MRRGLALVMFGFILFFVGPILLAVMDTPVHPIVPALLGFAFMFGGGFAMAYPDMVRDEARRRARAAVLDRQALEQPS